jgi:hypothetical protein
MNSQAGILTGDEQEERAASLWLRIGFWVCIGISIAAVLRRLFALAYPSRSAPQTAALDAVFASHATLTLAHILPALLFVLVAPLVVFRWPANTKWPERLIFPLGVVVGFTAYAMSVHSVGGWLERSAVLTFDSLFLFSLFRAYWHRQRGEPIPERRWMLRAIAVLLGIATTRPVMGIFFATSALTHLTADQFFGIAFWIGFSMNTFVIELWFRSRDHHASLLLRSPS